MNVYCIPGLAADFRVFKNLQLPPSFVLKHIDWIPFEKDESLSHYAKRLTAQVDTSKPFSLIGLSLGGMLVVEIALILQPVQVILISSIPYSRDLPPYYRWAGTIRLQDIIPIGLLQKASFLKRAFTTETSEEKVLLKDMIRKSDPQMIRWGLSAIIKWKQEQEVKGLVHIHGSQDFILPKRFTHPTHVVKGGGHMMIFNRADQINKILAATLLPSA